MMLSTEYREYVERRFHAFCKTVLHNEACDYYRERTRKIQHEISFEHLQENTSFAPHSVDKYFVLHDKPTDFTVSGQIVTVDSEKLAKLSSCAIICNYEISRLQRYWENRAQQSIIRKTQP